MAATGEELFESDVLWPDHQAPHDVPSASAPPAAGCPSTALARRDQPCPATASSRPVDIPRAAGAGRAVARWSGADDVCGTMVPPHVGCPSTALARRDQPCPATASSRPVDIPRAAGAGRAVARWSGADDVCGTMVPPHVMVSRRRSEGEPGAAAFSLRSGTGRARRDLSHLRNSVLRMTGFIEG
ncbi:hypothetical protein ABZP36_014620 [Zizania latifolia]